MSAKSFTSELDRAMARPDSEGLLALVAAYERYFAETGGEGEWPEKLAEHFGGTLDWPERDPDKALAYIVFVAAYSTNPAFIGMTACGPLEDILRQPSDTMISRVVAEARKSARFRWLLSHPFKVAVSEAAWSAIAPFRITREHEEPPHETMPPTYYG
jgi:hypothetical protein